MNSTMRIWIGLALMSGMLLGCQQGQQAGEHDDDHDHFHEHDHASSDHRPGDFAAAVASLSDLNEEIAAEVREGHAHHAEEALHQILDIARWLPEIAADSDMPEDQWNEVDTYSLTLAELIENTSASLHGSDAYDYSQTEADVMQIVGSLQKIVDAGEWNGNSFNALPNEIAADNDPSGE